MSQVTVQIIRWRKWTKSAEPPVERAFLAWFGKAETPWCTVLRALDDEGYYFAAEGGGEVVDTEEVSHWAELPKGPTT